MILQCPLSADSRSMECDQSCFYGCTLKAFEQFAAHDSFTANHLAKYIESNFSNHFHEFLGEALGLFQDGAELEYYCEKGWPILAERLEWWSRSVNVH